jgi:protein gp37
MTKTAIEWTQESWNPIVGCSIISPGCTNCYAMAMAARIEAANAAARAEGRKVAAAQYDGTTERVKGGKIVWTGKIAMAGDHILLAPLKRQKPTTYFVNSMGDLFHEDCPDAWIDRVFDVMEATEHHIYQILTKRSRRMLDYIVRRFAGRVVPKHIWLGVSTEDQKRYDERKGHLASTPAEVRFFSMEPLIGPIEADYLADWVIVGGESGPGARPMHPAWARGLRDQCAAAGVAFFFKQWGAWESFYDRDADDPDWRAIPDVDSQMGAGATRFLNLAGGIGFHGERLVAMRNIGKCRAGRLLDGVEHNGMPS